MLALRIVIGWTLLMALTAVVPVVFWYAVTRVRMLHRRLVVVEAEPSGRDGRLERWVASLNSRAGDIERRLTGRTHLRMVDTPATRRRRRLLPFLALAAVGMAGLPLVAFDNSSGARRRPADVEAVPEPTTTTATMIPAPAVHIESPELGSHESPPPELPPVVAPTAEPAATQATLIDSAPTATAVSPTTVPATTTTTVPPHQPQSCPTPIGLGEVVGLCRAD